MNPTKNPMKIPWNHHFWWDYAARIKPGSVLCQPCMARWGEQRTGGWVTWGIVDLAILGTWKWGISQSLSLSTYIYNIYILYFYYIYNINISDPQAQVISFKSPFFWGPRGEENQIGGRVGERTPRNGGLDGHALSAAWHRMVDGWMVGSPTPLIFVQRALEKVENHQF